MALTLASAKLSGTTIASSFDQLLFLDSAAGLVENTLKVVCTETGKSCLSLDDEKVAIQGVDTSNALAFQVKSSGGSNVLKCNASTLGVDIGTSTGASGYLSILGDTSSTTYTALYMAKRQPRIRMVDTQDDPDTTMDIWWYGDDFELRIGGDASNNSNSAFNIKGGSADGGSDSDDAAAWFNGKVGINGLYAPHAEDPNTPLKIWGQTQYSPLIRFEPNALNGVSLIENEYAAGTGESSICIGIGYSSNALFLGSHVRPDDGVALRGYGEDVTTDGIVSSTDAVTTYGAAMTMDGSSGFGGFEWWTKVSGSAAATTPNTSKALTNTMRLGRDGKLGVGNALATSGPSYPIHIACDIASYAMMIDNNGNNHTNYGIRIHCGQNDDTLNDTYYMRMYNGDGSAETGRILNNNGSMQFDSMSDSRLKENIVDTSLVGLDIVNALKVRDFKFKRGNTEVKGGFVAQEVAAVYDRPVSGKDGAMQDVLVSDAIEAVPAQPAVAAVPAVLDEDGNVIKSAVPARDAVPAREAVAAVYKSIIDPMGIDDGKFSGVLVKAIQELSAKVTALENA